MNDIILSTQNGEPVASSRQIAESFGKEHKHVLRDIENLIGGESKIGLSSMFFKSEYISAQNKKLPEYLMNRDGFSLLVMGFTGKETTVVHSDGHTSINKTPKVTGKGQIYFVNQFVKR